MRIRFAPIATIILLGFAFEARAQNPLVYKFKKGDRNTYEVVQEIKMTQTIGAQVIGTEMKQSFVMALIVDEAQADGSAKVTNKIEHYKLDMTAPGVGNVVFDSKDDNPGGDSPLAPILGKLVKVMGRIEFGATMSSRGESSDIKIPKELVEEMKNLPGAAQFGDMFSEQGLKNLSAQSGVIFPISPVKKGEDWPHKVSIKTPFGAMNTEFKYTYHGPVSTRDPLEKITFVSNTSVEAAANAQVVISIDSQKGEGTVLFDGVAGRVQQTELKQEMDMTVTVQNNVIAQRMEQKLTMRLKTK